MTQRELIKEEQYALCILEAVHKTFDEDEGTINTDEFKDPENLKRFIHAFANIAPTIFYCETTNKEVNQLEFNHIANQLVFEFSKK